MANRLRSTASSAFVFSVTEEQESNADIKDSRRQALYKARERHQKKRLRKKPLPYNSHHSSTSVDERRNESNIKVNVQKYDCDFRTEIVLNNLIT